MKQGAWGERLSVRLNSPDLTEVNLFSSQIEVVLPTGGDNYLSLLVDFKIQQ